MNEGKDERAVRVYGAPDGADRPAPAPQGLRGARATLTPDAANPALRRRVALDNGRMVELVEDSGVGWAEAEGRAASGPDPAATELAIHPASAPRRHRRVPAPMWIAAMLVGGAALGALRRRRRTAIRRRA